MALMLISSQNFCMDSYILPTRVTLFAIPVRIQCFLLPNSDTKECCPLLNKQHTPWSSVCVHEHIHENKIIKKETFCSVSSAGTSHHPHKSEQLEKFVCATPQNIILNKLGLSTSLGSDFEHFEVKCDAWGGSFY